MTYNRHFRNLIGIAGWFILTLLCTMLITLPLMYFREKHQSDTYGFEIERDDLLRYGITIILAQIVQIFLIGFVIEN